MRKEVVAMWDLFDFDGNGKTSPFAKAVGVELLESTSQGEDTATLGSESDDDELDEDDPDEYDEDDDEVFDDEDDDYSNEELL